MKSIELSDRQLALLGAGAWDAYEGEDELHDMIEKVGAALEIEAVYGEGYIDTVGHVCRWMVGDPFCSPVERIADALDNIGPDNETYREDARATIRRQLEAAREHRASTT